MVGAVDGEGLFRFQLQSQLLDGTFRLVQFLLSRCALQCQDRTAYFHEGSRQFQQDIQSRHGPAGGKIIGFPPVRDQFFRPARQALGIDPQRGQGLLQPPDPLSQRIQQGQVLLRAGDFQRHTGKSRTAAHVNEAFSRQIGTFQHRQAVRQM